MSNKKSSTSFLVQGSILAMASIISRIIGLRTGLIIRCIISSEIKEMTIMAVPLRFIIYC